MKNYIYFNYVIYMYHKRKNYFVLLNIIILHAYIRLKRENITFIIKVFDTHSDNRLQSMLAIMRSWAIL